MAAKQGLSAHISQASSDARQVVLTHTPAFISSHSWLSNLNTTCTIKSAPPRTPEVMSMLSSKSGWLMKRNESHVWQKRWCCVVPHTFLYYFDSCPIQHHGGDDGSEDNNNTSSFIGTSPVGIIDLECYTSIEQCQCVDDALHNTMEITGDAITNPDLRSFYFQCNDEEECVEWTNALLSDRHAALKDEREAYKQVCDTFPLQLKELSDEINRFENKAKESQEEVYRVRSVAEDCRKKVISVIRDALDRCTSSRSNNMAEMNLIEAKRKKMLVLLDKVTTQAVSMNAGVLESVQLLAEYTNLMHDTLNDVTNQLKQTQNEIKQYSQIDKEQVSALQHQLEQTNHAHTTKISKLKDKIYHLEKSLQSQRQENIDLSKNLDAKKMEFAMIGTSSKQKISELSSHKKILKREVIDLRKKVDEIVSEVTAFEHKSVGLDTQLRGEKERNEFLERHLNQVIQQIKLQEKMIDMMSQGGDNMSRSSRSGFSFGGNSVLGKEVNINSNATNNNADDRSYSSNTRTSMPPLPPRITSSFVTSPCTPSSVSLYNGIGMHTSPLPPPASESRSKPPPPIKPLNLDNNRNRHHHQQQLPPPILNVNSSNSTTGVNNISSKCNTPSNNKPRITVAMFDSATSNSESPITSPKPASRHDHDSDDDDDGCQSVDDNVSALTEDRTYSSKWGSTSLLSANQTNPNQPPTTTKQQHEQSSAQQQHDNVSRPPRPGSASYCSSKDDLNLSTNESNSNSNNNISIAHKARINADSPQRVHVRLPTPPRKINKSLSSNKSVNSSTSRSNSPSVWERLNSAITDVVSVTDSTDNNSNAQEKVKTYTLKERQRMQKDKQMAFLKQQGLITK